MRLKKLILEKNECYKIGEKIVPIGIMIHSTGANNPWLRRYINPDDGSLGVNKFGNHWNQFRPDGRQVCVHGFIGKMNNGDIATYQTLPWDIKGWHCGGKANDTHIGIEICEDDLKDKKYFNEVYHEALEVCIYLCEKYRFKESDIICHSEGYKLGIASNHADIMHWFRIHEMSMDIFRDDIKNGLSVYEKIEESQMGKGTPFLVKIDILDLRIRLGPGVNYNHSGQYTGKGIFTIVKTSEGKGSRNGWGKLKSGKGWISLDYVKRI